jgi:hypothetical protein
MATQAVAESAAKAEAAPLHDVFISYSRKDKAFAGRLEKALEAFKPPRDLPVPQRPLEAFLDEGDFTGVEYWSAVQTHLERSRKLIVVCSPAARASAYVGDEIERFLKSHGPEDLIPVLVAGVPNNEAASEDDPRCAFPRAMTRALAMPLAADWRGLDPSRERLDRGAFSGAWFSLLANLYGQSRAAIEQRELRRQARNRRITWGIAGGVIAALSAALVVSLVYRAQAIEQRDIARSEAIAARRETSERLAVQAVDKLNGSPDQALEVASQAIETFRRRDDPFVPNAVGAAIKVMLAVGGGVPALPQSDMRWRTVASDDHRWAAQHDAEGNVRVGRIGSREPQVLEPPSLAPGWTWSSAETRLAFGPRHLVALRRARPAGADKDQPYVDRVQAFAWPLDEQGAGAAFMLESHELESWSSYVRPQVSPDGRWVAWGDGFRTAFLRALEPSAPVLRLGCGIHEQCVMAFSTDSRRFVVYASTQGIRRFALPKAEGAQAQEEKPLEGPPGGEPVRLAFLGQRLAWIGEGARVFWWDLAEPDPQPRELPGFFAPYEAKLFLSSLDPELVRTELQWHPSGQALLASVVHQGSAFGFAAVGLLEESAWKPLWHRYDGQALDTESRLSGGGPGGVQGYAVKDSAELGVQQAVWAHPGGVMTLGFDGTVWYRDLEELDRNRFQLVERDASAVMAWMRMIIVGGRDGRLRIWSMKVKSDKPWSLNGLDAPVRAIRVGGRPPRLLAVDARGVVRVWHVEHPAIAQRLHGTEAPIVGRSERWLVTSACCRHGVQLWPGSGLDDRSIRLPESGDEHVAHAVEPGARWAMLLRREPPSLRLQLWDLEREAPQDQAPAEWRLAPPGASPTRNFRLRAPRGAPLRALLIQDDVGVWAVGLREHQPAARRLGAPDEGWLLFDAARSDDLRWVLLKTREAPEKPVRYGIVDLDLPVPAGQDFHPVLALPASYAGGPVRFAGDGRFATLEVAGYETCVLWLAPSPPACALVPREGDKPRLEVIDVPGRMPVAWRAGRQAYVLGREPLRFEPASIGADIGALAWDASGRWRATWSKGAGVVLQREGAAAGTRLPDPPAAAAKLERLFPFPEQAWVFASDGDGRLVAWHREAQAGWQAPFVLNGDDLRERLGPSTVSLSADAKTLSVEGQRIVLDPDLLMREAKVLRAGR